MLEPFIKPVLAVIAIAMVGWVLLWMKFSIGNKKKGEKSSFQTEITYFLFYIYCVFVLSLTVIPLPFARFKIPNQDGINIIPIIHTIRDILELFAVRTAASPDHIVQNIIGNIILFIPLGIFLPLVSNKYRFLIRVTLFAALCSASIESFQFILRQFEIYRSVDIDDVILNTTGAIIGFLIVKKISSSETRTDTAARHKRRF